MKHEEMERQIREAIISYHKETGRYVQRVDTCFYEFQRMGGGFNDKTHLRRLTITTTDEAPA